VCITLTSASSSCACITLFVHNHHTYFSHYSIAAVESVQAQGKICILDIDVQGVRQVKEQQSKQQDDSSNRQPLTPKYIFISPPSIKTLEDRLRGRGTETEEQMQTRLGNAQKELDYGQEPGNFDKVLVNQDLGTCAEEMAQVFMGWYPHLKQYDQKSQAESTAE
jgi:guanylate kinase